MMPPDKSRLKPSTFLLAAVLIALARTTAGFVNMQIKYACEGEILRLDCGEKFIKVWSALYGRANPTICQEDLMAPLPAPCRADKSNFETIRHCDGNHTCEVQAANSVFGEACDSIKKYLQVEYYCRSETPSECNPRDSPTYNTKYACDGTDLVLECPNPGEVIKILDANYGRQGSDVNCTYRPGIDDIFCDDDTGESFEHVCLECRGKDECTVPVGPQEFKDRCLNTNKYLSVQYVCVSTDAEEEDEEDERDTPQGSELPEEEQPRPERPGPNGNPAVETTSAPRPRGPQIFSLLKPGQAISASGSIGVSQGESGSKSFIWNGGLPAPKPGKITAQGSISSTRPDGTERSFTWGGEPFEGFASLFRPVGVSPGSTQVIMKIIVKTDSNGQKYFTWQPLSPGEPSGGAEYLMKIDLSKLTQYTEQFTFAQLIEDFNKGLTFYNMYNKPSDITPPFQFSIGKGLTAFFPSIYQLITEVDATTGKTVTVPSPSSSSFQVLLDGGNRQIIDYLLTFANMNQQLRSELQDYNLRIPLRFYDETTKQIQDIKIPFYVSYNGFEGTLSSVFNVMPKPSTQFGMKFQIVGEGGNTQLITLPFTLIEYQGRKMLFLTLPTCAAYKMYGFVDDKEYLIDPDGVNKGEQPFVVQCDMDKGETIINHNRKESTVATYPAGEDRADVDITYDGASPAQLAALRTVSETCEQELSHECIQKSVHFVGGDARIWWESLDGTKRDNWGGVDTGVSKCHCGLTNACFIKGSACNCDHGQGTSDWGALTDKDTLPVRRVVFKKPAAQQGQDKLKVGPLKCSGDLSSNTLQFFIVLMQMLARDPRGKILKTCDDYKKIGYELDGVYLIDPDGGGGEKPFTVHCDMQSQEYGVTLIHHELSNERTMVNNFEEPGSYSMDIHYGATLRQIENLKAVSGVCEQSLTYECQRSAFRVGGVQYHWWMSFDDEKTDPTCLANNNCVCDKDDGVLRKDVDVLKDKSKLPVMQLRYGDTGGSDELGYYTLGPLRCWKDSGKTVATRMELSSCDAIKRADPAARSGNYYIKPYANMDRFYVYCDMSGTEGVTVVYPDAVRTLDIDGFYEEPGTWARAVRYGPSQAQLQALTTLAASCKQFISHGCHGSLHNDDVTGKVYTWWQSRRGEKMTYWGDTKEGCQCFADKSCHDPSKKCNCDVNAQSLSSDEGYLTDKSALPVSAVRSGDVSDNNGWEYGTVKLGPLMCQGEQASSESREISTDQECESVTTADGEIYRKINEEQTFSNFDFSVQTVGTAILKLGVYSGSASAYYKIEIESGNHVNFYRCNYNAQREDCGTPQTQSFTSSPPGSSVPRNFTLNFVSPKLELTLGGESLTFTDGSLRGLNVRYFAHKTVGGDGKWIFDSICMGNVKVFCSRIGKVTCPAPMKPYVLKALYGRMEKDVCPMANDPTDYPDCLLDVTKKLQRLKHSYCVNGDHTCLYPVYDSFYASALSKASCRPKNGYLHLVYACRAQAPQERALGPCSSDPCQNGGTCDDSSDGLSYACQCHESFSGEHCETEMVLCRGLGDPHYRNFAGHTFDFQGNCTYVFARDCKEDPDFEVHVVNQSPLFNMAVSSTVEVILVFDGRTILLKQAREVLIDGERQDSLERLEEDFTLTEQGLKVVVHVPKYSLTVIWNHKDIVDVRLPRNSGGDVCGLCGNTRVFQPMGSYQMKSGTVVQDPVVFGNSWQVDVGTCEANTHPNNWAQLGHSLSSSQLIIAQRFCKFISQALVSGCPITAATADFRRQSCELDHGSGLRDKACSIINDFRDECTGEGGTVSESTNTQCSTECASHLNHTQCVMPCSTCSSLRLSPGSCQGACAAGCTCPDGKLDDGDSCVDEDNCGCEHEGRYYKLGSTFMDITCTEECTCQGGNVVQCGPPSNRLCPVYQTEFLTTCTLHDGVYECTCISGYAPNADGTACQAMPMDVIVRPPGRRRRRDVSLDECNVDLGMASGRIADNQISSSSSKDASSLAKHARPTLGGWTAQRSDTDQWLMVDVAVPTEITGVTTLGSRQKVHGRYKQAWVSAYGVDVRLDSMDPWTAMRDTKGSEQFYGNRDTNTPVTNMFAEPMRARYVRIKPISFYGEITMRLEVKGCKQLCDAEIGSFPVKRHVTSDNWFVVNAGDPINCMGHVVAWKVIHAREEPLEAWVLRPLKSEPNGFTLIGSTHIPAGPVDKEMEYELNDQQQIPVHTGDVIGFLYERNPLYSSEDGEETTDYEWLHIRDISNYETMKPGLSLRFNGGQGKRAFSAVAVLQSSNGVPVPPAQCMGEMGLSMDKMSIPDESFSASSHVKGHTPARGRLNTLYSQTGMRSGWTPRRRDRRPYLQVDLGEQRHLSGIITQGRHSKHDWRSVVQQYLGQKWGRRRRRPFRRQAWLIAYFVKHSLDCEHWDFVRMPNGQRQLFEGNVNPSTPRTNYLDRPVTARCIRIQPKRQRGLKIGLRLELLGCSIDPCTSSPCEQGGTCKQTSGLDADGFVCQCPPGWTGSRCEIVEGSCRSAGDSHYHTFDGRHFYFPGECTYTLAKDCANGETPTFDILTNNAAAGREIYIFTNNIMFEFKQEGVVHVDGEACELPVKRNGVSVVHNAYTGVLLQTTYGFTVEWDGHHRVIVNLPESYANAVCGLCGNFNSDKEDDIPQDVSEMQYGETFAVDPENCEVCQKCLLDKPYILNPGKQAEANELCNPIKDPLGPFARCHGVVSPDEIYDDCLQDVSDSDSLSSVPRCTQFAEYADVCAENGVVITSWREKGLCGITCPAGMIYTHCGSACPATCGDPHAPKTCTRPCEETCQCPEGLLKEGDKLCVVPSECGCTDNGCYFERGTTFYRTGCTERGMCGLNGEVTYLPGQCGQNATCGSKDGVYGCFCSDGFSGDGQQCTNIQDDKALLTCESEVLRIDCGPGKYIDIVEAVYGRNEDFEKCPTQAQPKGECSAPSAMSALVAKCQGREDCSVDVTSEVFGDPCYGVSKYLEVDLQCTATPKPKSVSEEIMKRVCQGDSMEIDCGDLYIEVVDAVYGRLTDGQVCPGGHVESVDCTAQTSLKVVQELCHGEHRCTGLQAANHVFGSNPCGRTFKYLEVKYKCSSSAVPKADLPANACAKNPCQHGGQCVTVETSRGYKCSCPHDWTGPNCEFEEVSCRASGVSHIVDFSEQHFEFLGDSKYDFASSCPENKYDFSVMIKKARVPTENSVSAIEAVHVHYDGKIIELKQEYVVLLDGKKVSDTLNLNFGKIKLCRVGNYLLLKTDFEMIVAWDGLHRVQVRMPDSVAKQTCGLCGTYRGLSTESPGFIDRDGNKVDDMNAFGSSWRVASDAPSFVHTNLINLHPCVVWPRRAYAAAGLCSELKNVRGVFRSCFGKVNPEEYYRKCMYDMCATLPSQEFLCQALAEYADICLDEGIVIDNWRASYRGGQCAMACPNGQMYSACVQSCPKSCGDPYAEREPMDRCYEGCACRDNGHFQDADQCLTSANCGCRRLGVYHQPEERVVNEHCTGQFICLPGGEWSENPLTCDVNAHCGVVDYKQTCLCNDKYAGSGKQCFDAQNVVMKVVSQGESLHIDCGDLFVDLLSADYSFSDPSSAGATTDPDCHAPNVMGILSNHISQGGRVLEVKASAYHLGETCRQTDNVLTVGYICSAQPALREEGLGHVVSMRGCQDREIALKCRKGSRIRILKAEYGRQTGSEVCQSAYNKYILTTSCRAPAKRLEKRVRRRCENREECRIQIKKRKLRVNPCKETPKYLDITYKCEAFEPN
ncbi:uncharacterized protein LOC110989137 [Acanthaster planci]|uniref:Uncharacterized protein LOC110989137 n=1 Tax=Acanthaster planci TaxID=133434 RepID=A0A8B7ZW34_ACAPL|nr:uncharacterized protein LOC110989137 [Acanthaster planci]XP_022108976.1 uncharacterized protein LOC110989137 [Acanthaster planci]